MEPAIEQVADSVYSAVGFDVANSTFIVGDGGVIVIDAMTSTENMASALRAFREISELPVKGVLYTHSHGDHWGGSPAPLDGAEVASGEVPVIARRMLMGEIARINGFNRPIMGARGAYQFGTYLEHSVDGRVNVGAGPFLGFGQAAGPVPPNTPVDDRLEIEIAGVRMEIVWVPSEAPDEIAIRPPEHGVLQSAECVQGECYLGFNRGEVTDFDPAPCTRRQRGYVEAMGGREWVCELAREAMDGGDERWAIELLGYVVRSDPDDMDARRLSAEAHRRECFRKANATWRNRYLSAAAEPKAPSRSCRARRRATYSSRCR